MRRPRCLKSSRRCHASERRELPALIARWLDALDETGRWALLKLSPAASDRRIGAAGQNGRRRRSATTSPTKSNWSGPGLRHPIWICSPGSKVARETTVARRSGAFSAADARACAGGKRSCRLDPAEFMRGMEMGRHPRAGGRGAWRAWRAASRGSIRAPARTFPPSFPDLSMRCGLAGAIDGEL